MSVLCGGLLNNVDIYRIPDDYNIDGVIAVELELTLLNHITCQGSSGLKAIQSHRDES